MLTTELWPEAMLLTVLNPCMSGTLQNLQLSIEKNFEISPPKEEFLNVTPTSLTLMLNSGK